MKEFWHNGDARKWIAQSDEFIQQISSDVNGPLLEHLVAQASYDDAECVQFFRDGAPLAGQMPSQGGEANKLCASCTIGELWDQCGVRNRKTVNSLKEDKHSSKLLQEICDDAALGRMTSPKTFDQVDSESLLLAKRFSVEQGTRADGSTKIRAVDDESRSGVNGCTQGGDKIKCGGLDALVGAVREYSFHQKGFKKLGLWKADIKSAYRRVPIAPRHRWMAWVVLKVGDEIKVAGHNSCMFGAVASVIAWDRIGEMIRILALRLLKVPSFRWVDDYFCVEPEGTVDHTKMCFARMVRAMLGESAIEAAKLEHGNPLTILGLDVHIKTKEIVLWPTRSKIAQWSHELVEFEKSGIMHSGQASKMAGKLNFSVQHCFKKFGRAMIRPFYCQQYAPRRGSQCDAALLQAVKWWIEVFKLDLTQSISLKHRSKATTMFCDASSSPPIVAAVLFHNDEVSYCVSRVPDDVVKLFDARSDNQIMALELYAILTGICSFRKHIANKTVRIWTDNVGGECALKKQTAKAQDHNRLVHRIWVLAAQLNCGIWIGRVPSALNIADGPTRPNEAIAMSVLDRLAATEIACKLPGEF